MSNSPTTDSLTHPVEPVKSPLNRQLPLRPKPMIHHNRLKSIDHKYCITGEEINSKSYGVSRASRILSPGLFLKKFDYIRDCLRIVVRLSPKQVEVVIKLLRFQVYYGRVYPKAATLAGEVELTPQQVAWRASEGLGIPPRRGEIGRATVWRTIRLLEEGGLVTVINRYIIRPHAQISNLYQLDKLLIVVAKYLCEHIVHIWPEWLEPYLLTTWPLFWERFAQSRAGGAGPP